MLALYAGSTTMVIAAFVGLWRYQKLEPKWLRLLTWFIITEFVIQFLGYFYVLLSGIKDNIFIFNINIYVEYGFYLYLFYRFVRGKIAKNIVLLISIFFTVFFLTEVFILNPFLIRGSTYSSISINLGEILTLICSFIFLAELLMDDENVNFLGIPAFWVTTGIMVEITGIFLYTAFQGYIDNHNLDSLYKVYGMVMTTCNILEYGFFAIALAGNSIWKKSRF